MMRFVVMRDYGCYEGWKILSESDSLLEAVRSRETHLGQGGPVEIFEYHEPLEAYRLADDQQNQERARQRGAQAAP